MREGLLSNGISHTLSTENIQVQKDVSIVNILTGYFGEIVDIVNTNDIKVGRALRRRDIRVLFARIDEAIKTRFGITVKTVEDQHQLLAIQTATALNFNILAGDVVSNYDYVKSVVENEKDVAIEDVDVKTNKWGQVLKTYKQSIDAIEHKLGSGNITVDLKAAKIYGYPDKSATIILINPISLIKKANFLPTEITAAYLHEIGHAFTHLEYSHRTIRNTSVLIESILDEVGHSKGPLDAIKLGYQKTFDDGKLDNTTNVVSAAVGVTDKYLDELRDYGGSTYGRKDSERIADQFVARFGEGVALVSALDKLRNIRYLPIRESAVNAGLVMLQIYIIGLVISVLLPGLGMFVVGVISAMAANLLAYAILGYIVYSLFTMVSAIFDRGIDTEFPYDSPKRRVLRIKNELVRQLRTSDLDKESTTAILASIDTLLLATSSLNDDNETTIYKFIGSFFNYSTDQNQMRDLDNFVNDLMNNDLHTMASRLKNNT